MALKVSPLKLINESKLKDKFIEELYSTFNHIKKDENTYTIKKNRQIKVTVGDFKINGNNVTEVFISFYVSDSSILIISELPCLEDELKKIQEILAGMKITITALNNHWLFIKPTIMYIYWMSEVKNTNIISDIKILWDLL